jgi:hypothetical protein
LFASPRLGDRAASFHIVYDQDQLVIVIAVKHFDVDAGLSHLERELAELTGLGLVQALGEYVTLVQHFDASRFQRASSMSSIFEEEMRACLAIDNPYSTAFDADAIAAESVAHRG